MLLDRVLRIVLVLTATVAIGGVVLLVTDPWGGEGGTTAVGPSGGGAVATADVGGPFEVVDHTGQPFTEADLRGDFSLIYFGYTYCPDVCPTELGVMTAALGQLDPDLRQQVQPYLVTIDPARDTPEAMADYVGLFSDDLIGLTGSEEQITRIARAYRVFYQRVESAEFAEYLMDHSSYVYLMNPEGENAAVFPYGMAPDRMADGIRQAVASYQPST